MTKICAKCKQEKSLEQFNTKTNRAGKIQKQPYCKDCNKEYHKQHYNKNKKDYLQKNQIFLKTNQENLLRYLSDKKCTDCPESDSVVLEFDHLKDKIAGISEKLKCWSWERLLTEIEKCEIVCCNCHRRRTLKRSNSYKIGPVV